jgi:hypothetical protein
MFINLEKKNNSIFNLIIFFLFIIFFSRSLVYLGFPKIINHLHYLIFIILLAIYINFNFFKSLKTNKFILILLIIILFSSLINETSIMNFFIYSLITIEPFFIYFLLDNLLKDEHFKKKLEKFIFIVIFIHTVLVYIQYFIFGLRHDEVQGLLVDLGAGAHVAGSMAVLLGLYIFFIRDDLKTSIRVGLLIFFTFVIFFSDAKQVILGLLFTFLIFVVIKFFQKNELNIKLKYIFITFILFFLLNYSMQTDFFNTLLAGRNLDNFIDAISKKNEVFDIINSNNSFINFLLGNGPGHTSSRLAFMIPAYENITPLSFSKREITDIIWTTQQSYFETNTKTGSSLFSLFFFWGGIYGDVGLLGVLAYIILWINIIKNSNDKDLTFFIVINILLMGYFYNWPEEPSYIFLAICIISLLNNSKKYFKDDKV